MDIFTQNEMDCFFPKGVAVDFLYAISEFSKSPVFKCTTRPSIVIRGEEDFRIVSQDQRLIDGVLELTVSQKDPYLKDEALNLNLVF
jgi:hypothetical protein